MSNNTHETSDNVFNTFTAFNTQQMIMMMAPTMIHIMTSTITSIFTGAKLGAGIAIVIVYIFDHFKNFIFGKKRSVIISCQCTFASTGNSKLSDMYMYNLTLIKSVINYVTIHKNNIDAAEVNFNDINNINLITNYPNSISTSQITHLMRAKEKASLSTIPKSECTIDGITIVYKKNTPSITPNAQFTDTTTTLMLSSYTKTTAEIEDFILMCYRRNIDSQIMNYNSNALRYLVQIKHTGDGARFKQYTFERGDMHTAFDAVFIPKRHITKIKYLLTQLKDKKMDKVVILFTSKPGCGKTTTERACINFLGLDVIVPKLCYMKNDDELADVYYSNRITTCDTEDRSPITLANERVYLLSDLDADSKTLHCRKQTRHSNGAKQSTDIDETSGSSSNNVAIDNNGDLKSAKSVPKQPGISLSGYLNVKDGVKRLKGIAEFIDTNHPEILDEAVKRHGRITYWCHLEEMTVEDAHRMIRHHFDGETISDTDLIRDHEIIPCDLEAMCQQSKTLEDLEIAIKGLNANYQLHRLAIEQNDELKAEDERYKKMSRMARNAQ